MRALLCNLAVVNDQNLIGILDGIQTVGDYEKCLALYQFRDGLLNIAFVISIYACGSFIQNDDRGIFQDAACNRDALLFTAGECSTAFTNYGLESIRQRHDEIIAAGLLSSCIDFFLCGVRFAYADIVVNGILE